MRCRNLVRSELLELSKRFNQLNEWQYHMSREHDNDSCQTCQEIEKEMIGTNKTET